MTLSHLLHLTCNSAAAMHDRGNLEMSLLQCSWASVYKRACFSIGGYAQVPATAAVHEICDLKIKQQAFVWTTVTDWLTVGGQQEVGCILLRKPSDFVDLLLNLQTLQVVKLWFVALECAVNIVLSSTLRLALTLWEKHWRKSTVRLTCFLLTARA